MSTTKILVCCHKPDQFVNDEVYMPIHVGKANSKYDLGIQGDDTGDNISKENPHFCELTGLYWAWKNMKPVDYIGLCHYRRYFNFHSHGSYFSDYTIVKSKDFKNIDLSIPDMDKLFAKFDVIISKPRVYPYSLAINYSACQVSEDLMTLCDVVKDLYPNYEKDINEVLFANNKLSHYNMVIFRWKDFDNYCTWLFEILFECKKRINIENYSVVQGRIWGYMSERLLPVWIHHQGLKAKKMPVYWIVDDVEKESFMKRLQRYVRKEIAFGIIKSR